MRVIYWHNGIWCVDPTLITSHLNRHEAASVEMQIESPIAVILPQRVERLEAFSNVYHDAIRVEQQYGFTPHGWHYIQAIYAAMESVDIGQPRVELWSSDTAWLRCGWCDNGCLYCRDYRPVVTENAVWLAEVHRTNPAILADWVVENLGSEVVIREPNVRCIHA